MAAAQLFLGAGSTVTADFARPPHTPYGYWVLSAGGPAPNLAVPVAAPLQQVGGSAIVGLTPTTSAWGLLGAISALAIAKGLGAGWMLAAGVAAAAPLVVIGAIALARPRT